MDKKAVLGIIEQFRNALEKEGILANKIILFGSQLQKNQSNGSDIDLVVVSDDFIGKSFWQRIELLSSAIYSIFQPIEAVAMTIEEWENRSTIISKIAHNGEIVFAA